MVSAKMAELSRLLDEALANEDFHRDALMRWRKTRLALEDMVDDERELLAGVLLGELYNASNN